MERLMDSDMEAPQTFIVLVDWLVGVCVCVYDSIEGT